MFAKLWFLNWFREVRQWVSGVVFENCEANRFRGMPRTTMCLSDLRHGCMVPDLCLRVFVVDLILLLRRLPFLAPCVCGRCRHFCSSRRCELPVLFVLSSHLSCLSCHHVCPVSPVCPFCSVCPVCHVSCWTVLSVLHDTVAITDETVLFRHGEFVSGGHDFSTVAAVVCTLYLAHF